MAEDVARVAAGAGWDEIAIEAALRSVRGMLTEAYGQALGGLSSVAEYPVVDASVWGEWAERFRDARMLLATLPEGVRSGLLARAAEVMAGTHQDPPVVGGTEADPEAGAAAYAELYEDMVALVAAATHTSSGQGWLTPDGWARAVSEELLQTFGTRARPGFPSRTPPDSAVDGGGVTPRPIGRSPSLEAVDGGSGSGTGGEQALVFLDEPRSGSPKPVAVAVAGEAAASAVAEEQPPQRLQDDPGSAGSRRAEPDTVDGPADEPVDEPAVGEPGAVPERDAAPVALPGVAGDLAEQLESVAARLGDLPDEATTPERFDLAQRLMWSKNVELPPLPGGKSRAPVTLLRALHHALVVVIEEEGEAAAKRLALRVRDALGLAAHRVPVLGGAPAAVTDPDFEMDQDEDEDEDDRVPSDPGPSRRQYSELELPVHRLKLPRLSVDRYTDRYVSRQPSDGAVATLGDAAFLRWHVDGQAQIPTNLASFPLSHGQVEEVFGKTTTNDVASLGGVWDHVLAAHRVALSLDDTHRLHQWYHALGQATSNGRIYILRMKLLAAARQFAAEHQGSIAEIPARYMEEVNGENIQIGRRISKIRNGERKIDEADRVVLNELGMRWRDQPTAKALKNIVAAQQWADAHGGSIAGVAGRNVEFVDGERVNLGTWIVNVRCGRVDVDDETLAVLGRLGMQFRSEPLQGFKTAAQRWADRHGGSIAEVPVRHREKVNGEKIFLGVWLRDVSGGHVAVDTETRDFLDDLHIRWRQLPSAAGADPLTASPIQASGSGAGARVAVDAASAAASALRETVSVAPVPSVARTVARHGLRMKEVPGDGNCFVTSFAHVYEWLEGARWTGSQVRETLAQVLRSDVERGVGARLLWPLLEPVVLRHTAEVMAASGWGGAQVADLSWQERVDDAVGWLLAGGGVSDRDRNDFAEFIAQPGQWMSSAGDAIPQVASLVWNVRIQVTQVAIPTAGEPQVSAFLVGEGERVVRMVRQFHVTDEGRPVGEHWSPAVADVALIADLDGEDLRLLSLRDPELVLQADPVVQAVNAVLMVRRDTAFGRRLDLAGQGDEAMAFRQEFPALRHDQAEHEESLRPVTSRAEIELLQLAFVPGVEDPAGRGAAFLADLVVIARDAEAAAGAGLTVMRAETHDSDDVARRELVKAFLTADEDGRRRIGRALATLPVPGERRTPVPAAPDTVPTPAPQSAADTSTTPAPEGRDALLARLSPEVRPAVRLWDRPIAEETEGLRTILRTAGSRSLVFSTGLENPVWALNLNGAISWFSTGFTSLDAPGETHDQFFSIDIDAAGQLTGPRAKALKTAEATASGTVKTGYCDVGVGTDLSSALGW